MNSNIRIENNIYIQHMFYDLFFLWKRSMLIWIMLFYLWTELLLKF